MEILQNSLIKLISRQGADSDRVNVLLASGEFGYSTDTSRLFIGDGFTYGGNVVGNKFLGITTDLTSLPPGVKGDTSYNSDNKSIFQISINDGSNINDWIKIGGVYSSGTGYLTISDSNVITMNALSANALSNDLVSGSIILNSGRLALSATIPFQSVSTKTITVSSGLEAYINGSKVTNFNSLSSDVILKNNQILARYDGLSGNTLTYSRNLLSAYRLSAGDYKFDYPSITASKYPTVNIIGVDAFGSQARVVNITNTSCNVHILSSATGKTDANIVFKLDY